MPVERVIDIHRHLWDSDWFPPDHRRNFALRAAARTHPPRDAEEILPRVGKGIYDPDGSQMLTDMETLGIDTSVVMIMDWGMHYLEKGRPDAPLPIEKINEHVLGVARAHPGKVYAFAGVDPRRENAVELFERAVTEWGAIGLKVYPPYGFYANDERMLPLYQKASDLGVPVLIHCGGAMFDLLSKYPIPEPIEEVAVLFPDLDVIMGHVNLQGRFESGAYWRGIQAGSGPMNIWLDICDWQVLGAIDDRNIAEFFQVLGHMRFAVGAHRILWGTDLPMRGSGFQLTKRWTEIVKNLPEEAAKHGVTFTQEEAEFIAHGNAERLLGI